MRKRLVLAAVMVTIASGMVGATAGAAPLAPGWRHATSSWPHDVVGGFSTRSGGHYALVWADGYAVGPLGTYITYSWGDASFLPLNAPLVGGALRPNAGTRPVRGGYWLVAADGGVFAQGYARNRGSMGGKHLNQPIVAIAPTSSGTGYWLVARDGGVFSFGDAHFYGSTGNLRLQQPIIDATASPVGQGYRMVARDGGIFTFGNAGFYGSLPARGVHASDIVGMAATPTNKGYWIARANGQVYAFGDAEHFANKAYVPSACDPAVTMITNPRRQGFRLVLESGVTIPFGEAPGGPYILHAPDPVLVYGSPVQC